MRVLQVWEGWEECPGCCEETGSRDRSVHWVQLESLIEEGGGGREGRREGKEGEREGGGQSGDVGGAPIGN